MLKKIELEEEPILYMPRPVRQFDVKSFEEAFLNLEMEANSRKKMEDVPRPHISNISREMPLNPEAPPFDPTLIEMVFPCPIVPLFLNSQSNSGSQGIGNQKNGSNLQVFQNLKK